MEPQPITLDHIGAEWRQQTLRQEYTRKPAIEGVKIVDLRLFTEDGGSFAELTRFDDEGNWLAMPEFKVRQTNFSEVLPGAIKAWHFHLRQEDVWFVPPTHRLLVGLLDIRADSATRGQTMRFVLGAGKAQLLYIPRGVAHGCANPWNTRSLMFYFVNQHFSADNPDEQRLPYDVLSGAFWEIQKG